MRRVGPPAREKRRKRDALAVLSCADDPVADDPGFFLGGEDWKVLRVTHDKRDTESLVKWPVDSASGLPAVIGEEVHLRRGAWFDRPRGPTEGLGDDWGGPRQPADGSDRDPKL